jgi:hypothetical protein
MDRRSFVGALACASWSGWLRPAALLAAANRQQLPTFQRSLGLVDLFRSPDPGALIHNLCVSRTYVIAPGGARGSDAAYLERLKAFARVCADEGVDLSVRVMARRPLAAGASEVFGHRVAMALETAKPALRAVAIENEINNSRYWSGSLEDYAEHEARLRGVINATAPGIPVFAYGPASLTYIWTICQEWQATGRTREALDLYQAVAERRREQPLRDGQEMAKFLSSPRVVRGIASVRYHLKVEVSGDQYQLHFYEPWYTLGPVLEWIRQSVRRPVTIDAWELGFAWLRERADLNVMERELIALVGTALAGGVRGMTYLPLVSQRAGEGQEEPWLGLENPDGTARPALTTFRELAKILAIPHKRIVEQCEFNLRRNIVKPCSPGRSGATAG